MCALPGGTKRAMYLHYTHSRSNLCAKTAHRSQQCPKGRTSHWQRRADKTDGRVNQPLHQGLWIEPGKSLCTSLPHTECCAVTRCLYFAATHCLSRCLTLRTALPRTLSIALSHAVCIALPHRLSRCLTLFVSLSHAVYCAVTRCALRCHTLFVSLPQTEHSIVRRTTASYNSTAPTQASNEVQVGLVLRIYWPKEQMSFKGVVKEVDGDSYYVHYHDGTKQWEELDSMDWIFESRPSFRDTPSAHSTRIDRITWDRV